MLNSERFKIMDIAAIVGYTSQEMIMKNYADFIKDNHLKIDTDISLYNVSNKVVGNSLGNTRKLSNL